MPLAATVKTAVWPSFTLWLVGSAVMTTGTTAAVTDNVAAALSAELTLLLTATR